MRASCSVLMLVSIALLSTAAHGIAQVGRPSHGGMIFDEPPHPMNCSDRPAPLPPGEHRLMTFSPQARFARTHLSTASIPLSEVPALTIVAEPVNQIQIVRSREDHWLLRYCAMGEGNTIEEANGYLQKVSFERRGGLLTLNNTDPSGLVGGKGTLHVEAPSEAPITVHTGGGIRVHEMAAPLRISAGMAEILNTTGLVDASASQIFFAGSQGSVTLNASWDIGIKFSSQQFRGSFRAYAMRDVHVLFPPGFQTPVSVVVSRSRNFVCHADFCSKMKTQRENSLSVFTYGDVASRSERINIRSENAHVTFDTVQ